MKPSIRIQNYEAPVGCRYTECTSSMGQGAKIKSNNNVTNFPISLS